MEFVVFVGCAYGGQFHLNKYLKSPKKIKVQLLTVGTQLVVKITKN
jgi:hypothetical protein